MPRTKGKINKKGAVSKERQKETKEAKKSLQHAIVEYNKTKDFLEKSSKFINGAVAGWCIDVVRGEEQPDDNSQQNMSFYLLTCVGAEIISKLQKKILKDEEFLEIVQQLAALCFPYTPSLNAQFCFFLKKKYLASNPKTFYLDIYFFFLSSLLNEKNIEFSTRLTYLSGALQFYIVYKQYLTNIFIEKLFLLLNSSEAKAFFLEYKQKINEQINVPEVYIPNYQILARQSKVLWNKTLPNLDSEAWRVHLKKKITIAVKADNAFIKEHRLTYFSLFRKEFDDLIQLLFLDETDVKAKNLKQEIFSPTRTVKEQVANFTDKHHPLREFFSVELLNALQEKNQLKPQQLFKEYEDEESLRIKCETEKKLKKQRDECKNKIKSEQFELEKKREIEIRKSEKEKEKKFSDFCLLLNKFSVSLQKSIKFIDAMMLNPEKKNKYKQQFKTEFGKLSSDLQAIFNLINLKTETFIMSDISNTLVEMEDKLKKYEVFDEIKSSFIHQEIEAIKAILEKIKSNINDIVKKLNQGYGTIVSLYTNCFELLTDLKQGGIFTDNVKKKIEKYNSSIKKFFDEFCCYELALLDYKKIIHLSVEQMTPIENLLLNINALEKLNSQLMNEYKNSFTCEEKLKKKTKSNVESTPPKVNPINTPTSFLFKASCNNVKNESAKIFSTSSWSKKYVESITELKTNFFKTLAVVHLISKITLSQGRGKLAAIYIEKLNAYKVKIQAISVELSKYELEAPDSEASYVAVRMHKEKKELERFDKLVNSLMYILEVYENAKKEFYEISCGKHRFNKLLYAFKKELITKTVRVELMQKGLLSEDEVKAEDIILQIQNLEATWIENNSVLDNAFPLEFKAIQQKEVETQLDKKYGELEEMNKTLINVFIEGQNCTNSNCDIAASAYQPVPLVSTVVTPVTLVPIGQPCNFFPLPMPIMPVHTVSVWNGVIDDHIRLN